MIQKEKRFKATLKILKGDIPFKNFIEIGGTDASFKEFVPHESWIIIDKFGNPDIKVNLDGRATKLPFKDASIECFILTEVLEHLRMGTPLIQEIERCLIPGGILFVSVPNMVSLANRLTWLLGDIPPMAAMADYGKENNKGTGLLIDGLWEGAHVADFNKKRLQKYIERNDLKLLKFYPSDAEIKKISVLPRRFTPIVLGDFLMASFVK